MRKSCAEEGECCERILYNELIAEEEESVLKEILRSKAKNELSEKIESTLEAGRLRDCFHVAEELIDRKGE